MPLQAASNVAIGPDDVAITLSYGVLGTHLGVAIQLEDGSPIVMDLAFHRCFRVLPYPGDPGVWSAAIVPFPRIASATMVSILRLMAEKLPGKGSAGLNYGVNLKLGKGSIQEDGRYVAPPGSDGHTCSTIIADAFHSSRLPLVDIDEWKDAEEHVIWGEAIECMLLAWAKKYPQSQAFGQAKVVKQNNKGFRLLPEEVAAAAQLPAAQRPAEQKNLMEPAKQAAAEMRAACVAPPLDEKGMFAACVKRYEQRLAELAERRAALAAKQAETEANQVQLAVKPEDPAA